MSLSHLQRLEAETIQILREVVAETERPVMMYSIGKDSAVMLHIARKAFFPAGLPFPAAPRRHDLEVPRDVRPARPGRRHARHGAHRLHQSRRGRARDQSVHPRLGGPHRHLEDAGAQAGARQVRLRRRAGRRAPGRGEVAGQGARVLVSHRAASLGSQEPATGALAPLQRAQAQGGVDPRVPAVELDGAGRLALHRAGRDPDRAALPEPRAAGGGARRRARHGRRRADAAARRARSPGCARCGFGRWAATR